MTTANGAATPQETPKEFGKYLGQIGDVATRHVEPQSTRRLGEVNGMFTNLPSPDARVQDVAPPMASYA